MQIVRLDQDGAILHGRNLDFAGGNLWECYIIAAIYHLDDGFFYVVIIFVGFLGVGVFVMNVVGLIIVVKLFGGIVFDFDGIFFGVVIEVVMRGVIDIDVVIVILCDYFFVGGWCYMMIEGDMGCAMCFEILSHY